MNTTLPAAFAALILLGVPSVARAAGDELPSAELALDLGGITVRQAGKNRTAASVAPKLEASMVQAMNRWMRQAEALGFRVVVPETSRALLIGSASDEVFDEAADAADATWELFEELSEPEPDAEGERRASVFFLFDHDAHASPAWGQLLDHLVSERLLIGQAAESLRHDPNSLTIRDQRIVLQSTYDMAGDAAAGDDEFRLPNEIAHKISWMILADRYGKLPDSMLWGLGYVAEQRLFRSIYQFNATGFVAAVDHFDWPKKTREGLAKARKLKDFDLVAEVLRDDSVGRAERPQMIAWACMDYLLHKEPERLDALLRGLTGLHEDADEYGVLQRYAGSPEASAELLEVALDDVDAKDVEKHLKRVK